MVANGELFGCSVQGLSRYSESDNQWTDIETPLFQVYNIGWNDGHYYVAADGEVYRTPDFLEWELLEGYVNDVIRMIPRGDTMLLLGDYAIMAHHEDIGSWQVNERASQDNDGTYPLHSPFAPATARNDTIFVGGGSDVNYSPDGGRTWKKLIDNLQSRTAFPDGESVYYFRRHFNDNDTIARVFFAKGDHYSPVPIDDLEPIYEGPYYPSLENIFGFRFLRADDLLFYTCPGLGLLYSNDDGANWELLSQDLAFMFVTALAVTENHIYVAGKQHGIRRLERQLITNTLEPTPVLEPVVFPNPTDNILCFPEQQSGLIYSSAGQPIQRFTNEQCVTVAHLPAGSYVVKFARENLKAQLFIKN